MFKKKIEYVELSFLYFKLRNLYDMKYNKYVYFRNLISYICNISDYQYIRRIFEDLCRRNVFSIKQTERHIYYWFNPNNRQLDETPDISISWD